MHIRLKRQILPMLRRQFAIKRGRLWTARIVNINFGAGDEFSGPTCENREELNRAFKRRIKTNRQIFRNRERAGPSSRFPLTLPPPLFLFHAAKKGVDINGHENRLGRNPSSLCESFTRAHQDSAFKLVKSTTRGGGTRWYTQKRWAVPHSGGGCLPRRIRDGKSWSGNCCRY